MKETFAISDKTADELFPDLPALRGQPARLYLFPRSQEILIKSSHDRVDARGGLRLMEGLVQAIATFPLGSFHIGNEVANLSPSLRIAAGISSATPDDGDAARQLLSQEAVACPSVDCTRATWVSVCGVSRD
jgi:hypothetical protein